MPSVNIENEETHRLVKEQAELRGQSMTAVVTEAVREQLKKERATQQDEGLAERLLKLGRETAPLWCEPWRSTPHGDLLYDENGLPK